MMDFTGVKSIVIPEGTVKEILRDGITIWETPASGEIIIFPETYMEAMVFSGFTYGNAPIEFSESLSEGDVIIVYINGEVHEMTVALVDGVLAGDDGVAYLVQGEGNSFFWRIAKDAGNPATVKVTKKGA